MLGHETNKQGAVARHCEATKLRSTQPNSNRTGIGPTVSHTQVAKETATQVELLLSTMPSYQIEDQNDSSSDSDEEEEEVPQTMMEKINGALDTAYNKTAATLLYVKPVAHVCWIPFVMYLGSMEQPYPSLFQMLTPPMQNTVDDGIFSEEDYRTNA